MMWNLRRAARRLLMGACVVAACARDGSAQAQGRQPLVRDDTAAVARLLRTVRGVDPLLCELATRSVDMHGWWSHWGPMGSDPLEVDSASAALIAWIQRSHNDPAIVPRLGTAMRDSDPCVRRVAGAFLGRVEHSTATAALVAALDDANADTRNVAAIGLGLSEKPVGVVTPLVRRLRDDSPLVRRSAAWALGSLEATGAMTALIEVLQRDADARVRQAAAWALGQIDE
jgi:hypothetical protein